jgi:hypothetical protein
MFALTSTARMWEMGKIMGKFIHLSMPFWADRSVTGLGHLGTL